MPVANTKTVTVKGVEVQLFYINTLGEALGRTAQTIRKWEISGILPDCLFRDKMNRRMYSQEQIDAIVACAEKSNVRQGYSVANTNFGPRVKEALATLNKKYI